MEQSQVRNAVAFCRTCHVPNGVADVDDGRDLIFPGDATPAAMLNDLRDSWERLGGNNPVSRILQMASGQETPHSGGQPWAQGSTPYRNIEMLLQCFERPDDCESILAGAGGGNGDDGDLQPLLGSSRALHVWERFCADQPDDTPLPTDPRTTIRPGINEDRAVFFNAYYEDCREALPADQQHSKTCGEYRQRRDLGLHFLIEELPTGNRSAEDFNNSWQLWGFDERPENFDELYTLRYGFNPAPFHNPYPLPGEDPNETDGGSGQLPLGLRQRRDSEGNWTGRIGSAACFMCHGGALVNAQNETLIGLESLGLGNANYDVLMNAEDSGPFAGTPLSDLLPNVLDVNTLFNIGIRQRGQNNAVGAFEFLVTLLDFDSLGINPNPLKTMLQRRGVLDLAHPLAHTQDTPQWWNLSHRSRKFFDAGVSIDSTRIIMAAGPGEFDQLLSADGVPYRNRIAEWDLKLENYFASLTSPEFPGEIDEALAEQGAVLFHSLDLWSRDGNADRPQPLGGNGSCASCHGAYSPRYVNDPSYLEDPSLEGMAAHIVPLEVIGTDSARSDMLTPTLREGWGTTYWGFQEADPNWVAPEDKDPLTELLDDMLPTALRPQGACGWEQGVIGYQAPPLYGVWASAPYFHNGSVPTLEQVLDSSQRPAIWRRQIIEDGPVTGFDQRLDTAFDWQRIGWKHDALSCEDIPGTTFYNCNPMSEEAPSIITIVENLLASSVSWLGLVQLPDPAPDAIEKRLVFNSHILGNGKDGHEFSDVLTEQERRAIIEYLKTL